MVEFIDRLIRHACDVEMDGRARSTGRGDQRGISVSGLTPAGGAPIHIPGRCRTDPRVTTRAEAALSGGCSLVGRLVDCTSYR